jgi:para-aminobenzoate synthetase component 1
MAAKRFCITVSPVNLPKSTSLTDIFGHFSHKPWAMFLDSANSQHQDGRFDILVADPIATVTCQGKNSQLWQKQTDTTVVSERNPIELIQTLLDQHMPKEQLDMADNSHLPFLVGAMGLFGYDLGKRFEDLPDKNNDNYSAPDMAVGIYSWSLIKDNHTQEIYLCYLDNFAHPSTLDIQNVANKKAQCADFDLTSHWQANMTQQEYIDKLGKISDYLQAGDCYQINLAQRFSATYTGDEWQAYTALREANQAPFSAFIRLDKSAILSISPERFLSVDRQKTVQTKPIKGTRPRQDDPVQDKKQIELLLTAEKDQAENLMIVDLLRNDLSKHCLPNTVRVPELFKIESFAAVHHLVSTVVGKLKPNSEPLDLLQGAFPGGSITGAPKIRAMQIIDELEPNNRNIYCGSIGYLGILGDMDTNICIRTLLCDPTKTNKTIHCWAGGGIVLDSEPNDEYQESLDKVSKILPVLSRQHISSKDN